MEINNNDSLERALNSSKASTPQRKQTNEKMPQMSREEEIGFHKGALNTLVNERNEMFKMMQNVEIIMQAHLKRLEELGVKIQTQ
ncbi:MAG TPA: hypothetical protein HA368_00340 [Nanoarchaeota archaeon]|nr:hypothetical protein [Nanoarchaeota archaeon]HIJ09168.1 hypothetical protein [Nanoarchaeota archaeon]